MPRNSNAHHHPSLSTFAFPPVLPTALPRLRYKQRGGTTKQARNARALSQTVGSFPSERFCRRQRKRPLLLLAPATLLAPHSRASHCSALLLRCFGSPTLLMSTAFSLYIVLSMALTHQERVSRLQRRRRSHQRGQHRCHRYGHFHHRHSRRGSCHYHPALRV